MCAAPRLGLYPRRPQVELSWRAGRKPNLSAGDVEETASERSLGDGASVGPIMNTVHGASGT
jgi:hypothetical protein